MTAWRISDELLAEIRRMLAWWRGQRGGGVGSGRRGVILPHPPFIYGKLDEQLNSGTTAATMSIWTWSGSAWADSGDNIEVYAPPLLSSGNIASGKWVRAELHAQSGQWHVVSAEC